MLVLGALFMIVLGLAASAYKRNLIPLGITLVVAVALLLSGADGAKQEAALDQLVANPGDLGAQVNAADSGAVNLQESQVVQNLAGANLTNAESQVAQSQIEVNQAQARLLLGIQGIVAGRLRKGDLCGEPRRRYGFGRNCRGG